MAALTKRQREILAFIRDFVTREGVAPTLREIAEAFAFTSTASAQKHVKILIKKGLLVKDKHQKRGLTLVDEETDASGVRLPLVGTVAAGSPIENFGDNETVMVPPAMVGRGDHVVLSVRGLSMIEDGIHDGDRIIVRRTREARTGETVVALVDGEATLKRYHPLPGGKIRLQGANRAMEPIVVDASRVRIEGVLVGLLRTY